MPFSSRIGPLRGTKRDETEGWHCDGVAGRAD